MTLVSRSLAVLGFAVVALGGGCSINHHSEDFACQTQAQCAANRVCTDGFCVLPPDGGQIGGSCPSQCTSCNTTTKSCKIDCAANSGACDQQITCPTGWSCDIACSTSSACSSGVDCTTSKACSITCSGSQSCRNIRCGAGSCDLECSGTGSCRDFTCGAGSCKASCTGSQSCRNLDCGLACSCQVNCASANCVIDTCKPGCDSPTQPGGCIIDGASCNTCL